MNSYKRLVPGLRGADVPDLGPDEPLGADPGADGLAGQVDRGHPGRGPLPGSVLEYVPRVHGDDRGRARRGGTEPRSWASRSRSRCSRWTRPGSPSSGSSELPGTLGEALDELERDDVIRERARRPRAEPLPRREARGVGRLPHAGLGLGSGALPGAVLGECLLPAGRLPAACRWPARAPSAAPGRCA